MSSFSLGKCPACNSDVTSADLVSTDQVKCPRYRCRQQSSISVTQRHATKVHEEKESGYIKHAKLKSEQRDKDKTERAQRKIVTHGLFSLRAKEDQERSNAVEPSLGDRSTYIRKAIGNPPTPDLFGLTQADVEAIENPPEGSCAIVVLIWKELFPRKHPKHRQYARYAEVLSEYRRRRDNVGLHFDRLQSEFWLKMTGHEFERAVAKLLRDLGYIIRETSGSGDKGVDIFLGEDTIIQCKNHAKPIGPASVRDLAGTRQFFKAKRAILISTRGFTMGALSFAKETQIELWNVDDLMHLKRRRLL